MFARVTTVAFEGNRGARVDVQIQIGPGLPGFTIVGLPDKAVAESRERVRGALNAIGLALPPKRIPVNLAPADLPKEGSQYDLPIALGLMAATGAIARDAIDATRKCSMRCASRWRPVETVIARANHGDLRPVAHSAHRGDESPVAADGGTRLCLPPGQSLRRALSGAHLRSHARPQSTCRSKCLPSQPPAGRCLRPPRGAPRCARA